MQAAKLSGANAELMTAFDAVSERGQHALITSACMHRTGPSLADYMRYLQSEVSAFLTLSLCRSRAQPVM